MNIAEKRLRTLRKRNIPTYRRSIVKKRPLNPSPTSKSQTGEDTQKRRCNVVTEEDLTLEEDGFIDIEESEANGMTGITAPDQRTNGEDAISIEMVGNVTIPSISPDELGKRQVSDFSFSMDKSTAESNELNINWDNNKSLLNKLKSLAAKMTSQHDEMAELGHTFAEHGLDSFEGLSDSSDHTYCSPRVTKTSSEITKGLEQALKLAGTNQVASDRDFLKENNDMLHLVMETLLSVNKNIKGNAETLVNLDSRIITLEGKTEASLALLRHRIDDQDTACAEILEQFQREKSEISKEVDDKVVNLEGKMLPRMNEIESNLSHKLTQQRSELDGYISDSVKTSIKSKDSLKVFEKMLSKKMVDFTSAHKKDLDLHKKEVIDLVESKSKSTIESNETSEKLDKILAQKVERLSIIRQNSVEKLSQSFDSYKQGIDKKQEKQSTSIRKINEDKSQMSAQLKLVSQKQSDLCSKSEACEEKITALNNTVKDLITQNARLRADYENKLKEIDDILKGIVNSSTQASHGSGYIECPDLKKQIDDCMKRVDRNSGNIEKIGHKVDSTYRYAQGIDARMRKNNIIIDQLMESENEDTLKLVNEILDHALTPSERSLITVGRAYRLGVKSRDSKSCRKVFAEITTSNGKDLIIDLARKITRNGNNGRPYYISDDVPEPIKRKKADIHKYINYMRRRGRTIEKVGDDFMIDGRRWRYEELNRLPIGDRLMDSRTLYLDGCVAFQSAQSPLSNLYVCELHIEGKTYSSIEQAFQYGRAMHHGCTNTANQIKHQDDPHEVMNIMRFFRDDAEWANKRIRVMEGLIKHKVEQCQVFKDALLFSGTHTIIENTWNSYWGSGCAFDCEAVWSKCFPGQNEMGKLLERIRAQI